MDKIHKFSPIIKQKFGLFFGGHYSYSATRNKVYESLARIENILLNLA